VAGGEQRLDELAELRAGRDLRPVQVSRREMGDAVLVGDLLRLRPLSRALRAYKEDVQRKNPS
jgi:hypothetical protein